MLWPVVLLVAGLASMVIGLVTAFGGFMASSSPAEDAAVWLFPIGGIATIAALVWMAVLLVMGWLA